MANTDIREAIRTLVGYEDLATFESMICTVSQINLTTKTCKCVPINGDADFLDVLLCVGEKDGFVLIPKNNSLVAVTQLNDTDAMVTMVSEVDGILLNGDANGGLVKVIQLTTKLNNLENKVNALLTAYNSHVHVETGGTTAPTVSTVAGALTPTTQNEIENTTVQHG
jgi:hypothetical protein